MKINLEAMKELLVSLSQKNRYNKFLKNTVELRCKCGYSEMLTYYDFLAGGEFIIGQPASIISPFISEYIYDETIIATPIHLIKKCHDCGEEITAVFPLSVENLIPILQLQPPDPNMYG
jgi:hypothetical protein